MQGEIKVLDDALVADYLRRHPEFFLNQDELLADLRIPHARGSSVSLVERQMAVLRQKGVDMRAKLARLLDVARENDRMFELTRELTLQLLEADTLEGLVAALEDNLRDKFRVPYVGLVFFREEPMSVARTRTLQEAREHIPTLLTDESMGGALRPHELAFLFGEQQAQHIQSAAVMKIEFSGVLGVLALGSEDSTRYGSSVDTLFLGYVAQVLARLLPDYISSSES